MLHLLLHIDSAPLANSLTPLRPTRRRVLVNVMFYLHLTPLRVHIPEPSSSMYHGHRYIMMIITHYFSLSPSFYVTVAVMWVIRLYKAGKQHLDPLSVHPNNVDGKLYIHMITVLNFGCKVTEVVTYTINPLSGIPLNWGKIVVMGGKKLKGNRVWNANRWEVGCWHSSRLQEPIVVTHVQFVTQHGFLSPALEYFENYINLMMSQINILKKPRRIFIFLSGVENILGSCSERFEAVWNGLERFERLLQNANNCYQPQKLRLRVVAGKPVMP
ncbi:hypothetical protein YC2023_005195 [Brassica napus]